jgi:gluconolactonase
MVHRGEYDKTGCDILDVFWPPRPDFIEKMKNRYAAYNAIIPATSELKLVHDGEKNEPKLNWTEGPCWMNGSFYMSNMWFAPDFSAGSPEKSNLIKIDPSGKVSILVENKQTNGIMTLGNGNLAVCDMYGHKIVEMTPEGKFLRTIVESYNGAPLDGPNDLAIDSKGGIYFTDPQFTPGLTKNQPGKAVFYLPPGKTDPIRIINPGEMGNPNGVLISPDGKTLYLNNTRNLPVGNHIMAYDIAPDGMISNGREFCKLFIPPAVLDKADVMTGADGMKLDTEGNLYCATVMGVQIFNNKGEFVGIINLPIRPISLAFGGADMKTLYFACPAKIYSIKTNKTGLTNPIK